MHVCVCILMGERCVLYLWNIGSIILLRISFIFIFFCELIEVLCFI